MNDYPATARGSRADYGRRAYAYSYSISLLLVYTF